MPRDTIRSLNPLSETEQRTLQFLLDRSGQSMAEAEAERSKERERERKLRAQLDRKAALEARWAKRLASLHVDLDVISAKLFQSAPSGIAFRTVNEQLQKLADLVPTQSFFNSQFDTFDQSQIMLLAEIGLAVFEASAKQKSGPSLRQKMQSVKIDVGRDAPGGGAAPDDRSALAAAIVRAGRRRRGEEE